jgi:hypothetical protein
MSSSSNTKNSRSSSSKKLLITAAVSAMAGGVSAQVQSFPMPSPTTAFTSWTTTNGVQAQSQALGTDVPLFGTGTIDELFISNYGSLSYNDIDSADQLPSQVGDNIMLAPFYLPNVGGSVSYQVVDNTYDFSIVNDDVTNFDNLSPAFAATHGILVKWNQVKSADALENENNFSAFVVTDGASSYVVFVYEEINFTQDQTLDESASVGLFVNSEGTNSCWRQLNGTDSNGNSNLDLDSLTLTTNCANTGHWVMRLDEILWCESHFATVCGNTAPTGTWNSVEGYFENNDRWDYFFRYTCSNGLAIQPNVTEKDSYCVYDPDYYDSKWSCEEPPVCQDFRVASQFETQVVVSQANGANVTDLDFTINRSNIDEQISDSVNTLLQAAGLEDGVVVDINTEKTNVESFRELGQGQPNEVLVIEFTILVPTPGGGTGVTEEDIAQAINEVIQQNPELTDVHFVPETNVKDKTDACLTLCLGCKKPGGCYGVPPPIQHNACCGTCSSLNYEGGKAYSTLTHACCGDAFTYDPDTHTCCDYGTDALPSWTKVKGQNCS